MGGNRNQQSGGGQFKTSDAVKRYSRWNRYAMGLVPASAVPTFFYVENPVSTKARADAPEIGVSFSGTRRDVLNRRHQCHSRRARPSSSDTAPNLQAVFGSIVGDGRSEEERRSGTRTPSGGSGKGSSMRRPMAA